ncbi:hypothetical protein [Streptomyces phaeoluteigriseus]
MNVNPVNPPTPRATTHTRPRTSAALGALGALTTTAALLATACSGPGGVDLGTDWKGASAFALADVDGLVTVVGVNADRSRAQSLAVVPQQADDDRAVSPQIVELADGRWLVTVPRKGGKPDRRYLVNRADHTLDGLGGDERLRRVLPGKTLVAEVAGLPDAKSASGSPESTVLVRNPADWSTRREVKVPGTVGLAASDPASDTVCLGGGSGSGTRLSVVRLTDGKVTAVAGPAGLDVTGLACPSRPSGRRRLPGPGRVGRVRQGPRLRVQERRRHGRLGGRRAGRRGRRDRHVDRGRRGDGRRHRPRGGRRRHGQGTAPCPRRGSRRGPAPHPDARGLARLRRGLGDPRRPRLRRDRAVRPAGEAAGRLRPGAGERLDVNK